MPINNNYGKSEMRVYFLCYFLLQCNSLHRNAEKKSLWRYATNTVSEIDYFNLLRSKRCGFWKVVLPLCVCRRQVEHIYKKSCTELSVRKIAVNCYACSFVKPTDDSSYHKS